MPTLVFHARSAPTVTSVTRGFAMDDNSNRSSPFPTSSQRANPTPSMGARVARFVVWMTITIIVGHTFNQCVGRHYGVYVVPRGGSAEGMAEFYRK
jgi:hypothetical protein